MKNIKNIIRVLKTPLYVKYTYKWLDIYKCHKKRFLIDYIEEKVDKLSKNENIPIFSVSFDDINKDVINENEKAVGLFIYYKDNKKRAEHESIVKRLKNYKIPVCDTIPRIEITKKGDVYTKIHELGHYFLYKRNLPQSEASANMFIEEFFDNYLPPFFKWIYQIELKVRTKKEYNFTDKEAYNYYKEYKNFIKNGI